MRHEINVMLIGRCRAAFSPLKSQFHLVANLPDSIDMRLVHHAAHS